MVSVGAQPFSGLSRDNLLGLGPNSGHYRFFFSLPQKNIPTTWCSHHRVWLGVVLMRWCSLPGFLHTCRWEVWLNRSIFVSSDQRILLFIAWESFRCFSVKLPACRHVPFSEEGLPFGHSTIKAWLVECSTEVLLVLIDKDHWVHGYLSDPRPFIPDYSVWLGGQIEEDCWWFQISSIWE